MQPLTQEQIVAIRKASHGDGVTPWSESIAFARNIEKAMGDGVKKPTESERKIVQLPARVFI